MISLALSRLIHATPAFLQRLADRVTAVLDGIAEARALAQRYQTLSKLSDAELAQRGLKREDIPQVVLAATTRP